VISVEVVRFVAGGDTHWDAKVTERYLRRAVDPLAEVGSASTSVHAKKAWTDVQPAEITLERPIGLEPTTFSLGRLGPPEKPQAKPNNLNQIASLRLADRPLLSRGKWQIWRQVPASSRRIQNRRDRRTKTRTMPTASATIPRR